MLRVNTFTAVAKHSGKYDVIKASNVGNVGFIAEGATLKPLIHGVSSQPYQPKLFRAKTLWGMIASLWFGCQNFAVYFSLTLILNLIIFIVSFNLDY